MPDCNVNFEAEIEEGQNKRSVKCKFCSSHSLPLIRQTKTTEENPDTETTSVFWAVKDMFTFQNVGFSNTVGNTKYLTCADCEAGPIGFHDIPTKMSFVALSRVSHGDPI
ncbi:hypothetical protein D910_04883 [Dendroctonus ponderosae]